MKERDSVIRTLRIYEIDDAVRSGKLPTARMLADKLEVSVRTIMRDIEFLRDSLGAPMEYDAQKGGWYYTEDTFFLKYTPIAQSESFALLLLRRLLLQYSNTPLEESLSSLFDRLSSFDADGNGMDEAFYSQYITYIPDVLPAIDNAVFNAVFKALSSRHTLQFDYKGLNDESTKRRKADPYHVVSHRGAWYVIAYCRDREDIRLFSFSRMRRARITDAEYTIPKDFDSSKYIDANMGVWAAERENVRVRLLFDKGVAAFARERHWGTKQEIQGCDDGKVEVCFETTQMTETARLVLGQCGTCEVLEPVELREQVHRMAQRIAARHGAYKAEMVTP